MGSRPLEDLLNDRFWSDVANINGYAVLMGHLSMSIKGLGFLVLTWTTVVLLGGFVSTLHRKDFWSLAFILLVQTAGIFDVALNEKLSYMMYSIEGLMGCIIVCVVGADEGSWRRGRANLARVLLALVLMLVQLVVLLTLVCPMAIIYVFGILMSGGISLWRLIEQGYAIGGNSKSNTDSSGEASLNMVPAMETLYYIALFQCVLFCYRFILGRSGKRFAKVVAPNCDYAQLELVSNYLHKIKRGCEKDPSFAKGRNLITHAIDMIGSNSPTDCISGVKTLYTTICISDRELKLKEEERGVGAVSYCVQRDTVRGQHMLIKHLIVSSSSSTHILNKLLETLDSRGLHDRETRNQAAMIVERFAFNISLEKFPRGIQHISSMIETFEEYSIAEPYQRDLLFDEYEQLWKLHARCLAPSPAGSSNDVRGKLGKSYKELLLQGLCILRKLATDEKNCRIMRDTPDLIPKIMAPVTSDLYHATNDHGLWSQIVGESMKVIRQLASAPGDIGAKLREEISSYQGAATTLRRILNCNQCNEELHINAIWILKEVYMGTQSRREYFVRMLVDIFTQNNKSVSIRELAGRALLEVLCFQGGTSDATIVIQTGGGDIVVGLTRVLVHDNTRACRQKAAEILEYLCTDYTKDDEYLGKLKKSMSSVMPEVLAAILRYGDETHNGQEDDQDEVDEINTDIENQSDDTQENDERHKEKKVFQIVVKSVRSAELLSSLLSLYATVYDMTFVSDLAPQLDASSFLNKLKEMVVKKSDCTVENLSVFKATGKMVISMMKHSGGMFIGREELESLLEALSSASKNIFDLDQSMVFSCGSSLFATTWPRLNRPTLASIVKEATELHAMLPSTSASG